MFVLFNMHLFEATVCIMAKTIRVHPFSRSWSCSLSHSSRKEPDTVIEITERANSNLFGLTRCGWVLVKCKRGGSVEMAILLNVGLKVKQSSTLFNLVLLEQFGLPVSSRPTRSSPR